MGLADSSFGYGYEYDDDDDNEDVKDTVHNASGKETSRLLCAPWPSLKMGMPMIEHATNELSVEGIWVHSEGD